MLDIYFFKFILYILISIILFGYYVIFRKYKWGKILLWLMLIEVCVSIINLILSKPTLNNSNVGMIVIVFLSLVSNASLLIAASFIDFGIEAIKIIKKPKWLVVISITIATMTLVTYNYEWFIKYPDIFIAVGCLIVFGYSLFRALMEREFHLLAITFMVILVFSIAYQFISVINIVNYSLKVTISSLSAVFSLYFLVIPLIWLHKDIEDSNSDNDEIPDINSLLCLNANRHVTWMDKEFILPPQAFFDLLVFVKYKRKKIYDGCINLNDLDIDIDHKRIHRLKGNFKDKGILLPIRRGSKVGYYYLSISNNLIKVDSDLDHFLM